MHPVIRSAVAALAFSAGLAYAQADKVVYHIDDAATQATKGLRNIRNHLDVAPDTQIVVVTHANGVDFLMDGAKDPKNPSTMAPWYRLSKRARSDLRSVRSP